MGEYATDPLIEEQIQYYRERAQEYDETVLGADDDAAANNQTPLWQEWQAATERIRQVGPYDHVLELACGTGIWTRELVQRAAHLTALDASPEMIALNRANVQDSRVQYECVNLFEWQPREQYDLVFMGFWLSHVPADRLDAFLDKVERATGVGGQVFILDEPAGTANVTSAGTVGNTQARTLNDGREFTIIKEYYDPDELGARLAKRGWQDVSVVRGNYFFQLKATHDRAN